MRDLVADVIEVRDARGERASTTNAVDPVLTLDPPVVHVHPGGTVRFDANAEAVTPFVVLRSAGSTSTIDDEGLYTCGSVPDTVEYVQATEDHGTSILARIEVTPEQDINLVKTFIGTMARLLIKEEDRPKEEAAPNETPPPAMRKPVILNDLFIEHAYRALLKRKPGRREYHEALALFDAGATRQMVARAACNVPEFRRDILTKTMQGMFGRPPPRSKTSLPTPSRQRSADRIDCMKSVLRSHLPRPSCVR